MTNKVLPPFEKMVDEWKYVNGKDTLARSFPEKNVVVLLELAADGAVLLFLYDYRRKRGAREMEAIPMDRGWPFSDAEVNKVLEMAETMVAELEDTRNGLPQPDDTCRRLLRWFERCAWFGNSEEPPRYLTRLLAGNGPPKVSRVGSYVVLKATNGGE